MQSGTVSYHFPVYPTTGILEMFNKGITTVLTLSTLAMDTRTDLPKVHYATALDWFILITFGYCMASIIQFASVHYFTKVIFLSLPSWLIKLTVSITPAECTVYKTRFFSTQSIDSIRFNEILRWIFFWSTRATMQIFKVGWEREKNLKTTP